MRWGEINHGVPVHHWVVMLHHWMHTSYTSVAVCCLSLAKLPDEHIMLQVHDRVSYLCYECLLATMRVNFALEMIQLLHQDGGAITSLCFTPDESILFTVSKSQILKKWNMSNGECTRSWKVSALLDIWFRMQDL